MINNDGDNWVYGKIVKEHFLHPKNFIENDEPNWNWNGMGEVGSPACGDVMKVWIGIEGDKITEIGWKTFGCASAIASTSVMSEMVKGMNWQDARMISAKDIVKQLGGLPYKKIHCSVLGDQALKKAIDYFLTNSRE